MLNRGIRERCSLRLTLHASAIICFQKHGVFQAKRTLQSRIEGRLTYRAWLAVLQVAHNKVQEESIQGSSTICLVTIDTRVVRPCLSLYMPWVQSALSATCHIRQG